MKKLLIIILFIPFLIRGQNPLLYGGVNPLYALDLDGSTEYTYKNTPTGLDLNGSEMITTTADRDFSGAGNWSGLTVTGGVGTFTTSASLPSSAYTDMEIGKNYTVQLDVKSAANSSFKIVVDNDSTTLITTTTSVTKAFTFTYSGGSQTVQLKGVGTDTWTVDNVSITEAYNLEIEGWFKHPADLSTYRGILSKFSATGDKGFRIFTQSNEKIRLIIDYGTGQDATRIDLEWATAIQDAQWHYYKVTYNRLSGLGTLAIDNATAMSKTRLMNNNVNLGVTFNIGSTFDGNWKFLGQLGRQSIKITNGLGTTVSTSIYDWKGSASTFLNDKKGTNNLTGVNVTLPDVVKYSQGKYK